MLTSFFSSEIQQTLPQAYFGLGDFMVMVGAHGTTKNSIRTCS